MDRRTAARYAIIREWNELQQPQYAFSHALSEPKIVFPAHHYVRVDDVKALLRIVLDEGEPETRSRARRLVNRLGEAGYEDFHGISE